MKMESKSQNEETKSEKQSDISLSLSSIIEFASTMSEQELNQKIIETINMLDPDSQKIALAEFLKIQSMEQEYGLK